MDSPESNSSSNDENVTPEVSDVPFPSSDDGAERESLEKDQIEWLRNRMMELGQSLETLRENLTTIAASPIPTPETVAEMVEEVTRPEREALKNLMNELQDLASRTQQPPEAEPMAQNTQEELIRTELPQGNADESPVVEKEAPKQRSRVIV